MTDGVIYKSNGTTWSKPIVKDSGATTTAYDNGKIEHSNGTDWFDNYPMITEYTRYFNVMWTQGYNGAGEKLNATTFGDHPKSGDSVGNFYGCWGFNKADIKAFVAGGAVQEIKIMVRFVDPVHAGDPVVWFYPNTLSSKPSFYDNEMDDATWKTTHTFVQTGENYSEWITLPVGAYMNGTMGGVTCHAPEATATNSCTFAGKTTSNGINAYTTKLWLRVWK